MAPPTALTPGRVSIAPDDSTLEPDPEWLRLDDIPNLVASYTIDRGRQYELDRTDGGRATVTINDRDGLLDPTNSSGDLYGKIEPLLQVTLGRYNPVADVWHTRFRGFISDWNYSFDPSQRVNRLTLELVGMFEILAAIQMYPGMFGDTPPSASAGQVFFDNPGTVGNRLAQIYGNADIPDYWWNNTTFSGNVDLYEAVYSPGESSLAPIQEAVDGEFPGVSNLYEDRFGRMAFHGRLAKFDPASVLSGVTDEQWDWHHWRCGDSAAVEAEPSQVAQIRQFAFTRGLAQVINHALATPVNVADGDVEGQIVTDPTSIGKYGYRSWSAQNLLTKTGLLNGNTDLEETKLFAQYRVDNYKNPTNRVTTLGFRSMDPDWPGAGRTWAVMCQSDISDQIDITVASPGGGGFDDEPFYIEGLHETNTPLNPDFDNVTVTMDVSPKALFDTDPWADE